MSNELHEICRRLLEDGTVQAIIGYARPAPGDRAVPVFVTRSEDVAQLVWDDGCFANLTKYLCRKEVTAMGKVAICVKGCDERALVVLEEQSQIDRSQIKVIGLACDGVGDPRLSGNAGRATCIRLGTADMVDRQSGSCRWSGHGQAPLCGNRRVPAKNARTSGWPIGGPRWAAA